MSATEMGAFPGSGDAATFLEALLSHVTPVKEMWPWFWVKLLAVRLDDQWIVAYLGCAGLFAENELTARGKARVLEIRRPDIVMVSFPMSATQVIQWWDTWAKGVNVRFEDWNLCLSETRGPFYTQGVVPRTQSANRRLIDVAESVPYTWFQGSLDYEVTDRPNSQVEWTRLDRAVQDVEPGGLGALIERNFGDAIRWPHGRIEVTLPLPLSWALGPDDIAFRVHSRMPFLDQLDIRSSNDGRWSDDNPRAPMDDSGRALLPPGWRQVWIRHPWFQRPILLAAVDQSLIGVGGSRVLGAVYRGASEELDKGVANWRDKLRHGNPSQQELAIANGLAKFGIPVLFGGTVLSTPAFDLAVLDDHHTPRRVLLIEVSTEQGGGLQKKANVLSGLVSRMDMSLSGWTCRGVVVVGMSEERVAGLSLPSNVGAVTLQAVQEMLDDDRVPPQRILDGLWAEPIDSTISVGMDPFNPTL